MINIITAVGNPFLNNELKKYTEFNVICNDIIYCEGIIEILEINNKINYLIIGEMLLENNLENLIDCIKEKNRKIKIIPIINKKQIIIENRLMKKGIYDIYYDDVEVSEIIEMLKTKNIEYLNNELRAEIESLKKIINEKKDNKNNKVNNIKNKIIGVIGNNNVGKSTFCYILNKYIKNRSKCLIVDFDIYNSQITYFYKKNIDYSKIDINNIIKNIVKIDDNTDILTGINYLYHYKKLQINKIKEQLESIKNKYDLIVIDTNFKENYEFNNEILKLFDIIIYLENTGKIEYQKNINFIKKNNLESYKNIKCILYKYKKFEKIKNYKNNKLNYIRKNK